MCGVFWGVLGVGWGGEGEGLYLTPSTPPSNPQYHKKTPHTTCIVVPEKLDSNLKMAHI